MKFKRIALTLGLVIGSGSALASASSTCSEVFDLVKSGSYTPDEAKTNYPWCFASSSPATTQQISATSFQQVSVISSSLGGRLLGGGSGGPQRQAMNGISGMAAGASADKWNGWASVSENANRYDATLGATRTKSGANITNLVLGGDYRLDSKMVLGLSAAFDRGTGTVGVTPTGSTTTGYSIAPYLGYQVSDKLAFDASVGVGEGESSVGAGRNDVNRLFFAGNATYADWIGNWQLTGKAGYLWAQEKSSDIRNNGAVLANTGATARLGQARVGVEAGYWYGNGVMPFVGVAYAADVIRATQGAAPWDRDGFTLSLGVNFLSLKDKITGGIVYTDETGRRYTRNSTLMGNINIRF